MAAVATFVRRVRIGGHQYLNRHKHLLNSKAVNCSF